MTTITTDTIRAAAERLIHEATLHHVEYGSDDLTADILLVGPAALAGLDTVAVATATHDALTREIEHWKGMYEQAHQQRSIWYERCQVAERQLAEVVERS